MAYDSNLLLEKMRADRESDWVTRLLHDIENAPSVDEDAIQALGSRAASAPPDLTAHEKRVLECFARGMTVQQTGDILHLARETIKDHLKFCRYKLRAKNTAHACCEAIRQGVIA